MKTFEGNFNGKNLKIAIVAARFNSLIVEKLIEGAIDGLERHEVQTENITIAKCPGAWELPALCQKLGKTKKYDAIIAAGCIIRGDTPHFDIVASECSKGIANAGMQLGMPIVFTVLTTDTIDQAMNRAGIKHGNKGFDAAMTAIEMANLYKEIDG